MRGATFRWFIRWIDGTILFWFTVWLFWIHKPVWRWIFLAFVILDTFSEWEIPKRIVPEYREKKDGD